MNNENNIENMNNMQNNPDVLPGLEPEPNNDAAVLPGMDNNMQNPNQTYENELGINMQQPMQNPVQQSMNNNPYQTNQDMGFNPYQNMDMPYGNQNQDLSGQYMTDNPYQTVDTNINGNSYNNNDFNQSMNGQFQGQNPNDPMNGQFQGMNPNDPMNGQFQGMNPNDPMNGQFQGMNPNDPMNGQFQGMNPNDPMNGQFQGMNPNDPMNGQFQGMNPNDPMNGMPQMDYGNMDNSQFDNNMGINNQIEPPSYQNYENDENDGDLQTQFTKAWMGSLYEKSVTKKFNWCAALFGSTYLLYRKIYLTGIITFLLQTVIIVAGIILSTKMPVVGAAIVSVISLGIFVGLGLGFYGLYRNYIKGKLQTYSRQSNDVNQLIDIASQKGGTSIIGVLLEVILSGTIIPIIVTVLISSGILSLSPSGSNINTNVTTNNTVVEEPVETNTREYEFDNEYSLSYDTKEWYLDETNKTLTKGNYSLAYATKFTSQQCGFDLSSADGRAGLLKYMTDSFNTQIAQSNMQIETGNENFIHENDRYYNYIDFITTSSIQRYYFIVLPEYNILFQFTLSINNTSIDDTTNIEIIAMLTNIEKNESSQTGMPSGLMANQNQETNTISNDVTGALSSDNQATSNNQNGASINNGNDQQQPLTTTTQNSGSNVDTSTNSNQAINSTALSQFIQ